MSTSTDLVITQQDPEIVKLQVDIAALFPQDDLDRLELAASALSQTGIHNDDQFREANELLSVIATYAAKVEEACGPPIAMAYARHKLMNDLVRVWRERFSAEKQFRKSSSNLREKVEKTMAAYRIEQERLRQQQERELAKITEKIKREQLADAKKLMAQGAVAEAKELQQAARALTTPTLPDVKPTLQGTKERINWEITITDLKALVDAVASGAVPLQAVTADEGFIKKQAAMLAGLTWPGVQATPSLGFAVSRKS